MDTVIAVLVGSGVSLAGNLIQYCISRWKEDSEWQRKRKAEEDDWVRTNKREEVKYLRDAYQNSISSLSLAILTLDSNDETRFSEKSVAFEYVQDVQKWIARIYLRHPSEHLQNLIESFANYPRGYAHELCMYVIKLARSEEKLFLSEPIQFSEPKSRYGRLDREVKFLVDEQYLRERFVAGREFEREVSLSCALSDINPEERSLLVESISSKVGGEILPKSFWLPFPTWSEEGNVNPIGEKWRARVDPVLSNKLNIFRAWYEDYQAELARLNDRNQDSKS